MNNLSPKATILAVDDNPENLRVLMQLLQEQSYQVRPAPNGVHALTTALKEPPDLVLLDIVMPEMDGYEVCRHLKADERTRHIPVIFISALNEPFDKIKAFSVGGVDYVTKPFEAAEVLARIQTQLALSRLQQELHHKNLALAGTNETLEEKIELRTAELAQANLDLQVEIERRISHQQEKDRLFTTVSWQSEQLRQMTALLIDTQQRERQKLAAELGDEITRKVDLLQTDLTAADRLLNADRPDLVADRLKTALQVLAQMEQYIIQITGDLPQPTTHEQSVSRDPLLKLTGREREVLQLLAQGKTNREIAATLEISTASIHTYNRRLKTKLNINDVPGLVKFALEHNLTG